MLSPNMAMPTAIPRMPTMIHLTNADTVLIERTRRMPSSSVFTSSGRRASRKAFVSSGRSSNRFGVWSVIGVPPQSGHDALGGVAAHVEAGEDAGQRHEDGEIDGLDCSAECRIRQWTQDERIEPDERQQPHPAWPPCPRPCRPALVQFGLQRLIHEPLAF